MATLKSIFKLYDGYSSTISTIDKKTNDATNKILKASGATDSFNKKLKATGASAEVAGFGLGKLISITALVAGAVKGMHIADEFTNTSARLALINDGLQTQAELQKKIFAAAERSRGSYTELSRAISKMGLLASDAFGSNDELTAFTELLQKSFKVSGASTTEQSSALLQLSQAMAAGRLQGDEFRSIIENAPMLATAIAKFTGKSKGELKEMSAEGTITADIIKNALFMAGDDINTKFATLPMTFGDIWIKIKNGALKAFQPVIEKVNSLINTPGFTKAIDNIIKGISFLASGIVKIIGFIQSNWGIIEPILIAIGAAFTAWAITQIPLLIVKLWAMVAPVLAQAAAWLAINWPILLIVAAIGLLLYAILKAGDTVTEVVGVVGGVLGGLFAYMYNMAAYLINPWLSFAEFFANVFNNPVYSIKKLFVDLAINVLNMVQSIASAIDNVLGTNMSGSLQKLKDGMTEWLGDKPEDYKEFTKMEMKDITSNVNLGYDIGKKAGQWAVDGVQGLFGKISGGMSTEDSLGSYMTNGALPVTGAKGGKVEVKVSDEDIKHMRDIAERDYINKFSTATLAPKITVKFGDVHEEADANKVAGRIKKILQEEIATAAEGIYS